MKLDDPDINIVSQTRLRRMVQSQWAARLQGIDWTTGYLVRAWGNETLEITSAAELQVAIKSLRYRGAKAVTFRVSTTRSPALHRWPSSL
jgi:membrane protein YdbS with pleckstrin-like domain